MKQTSFSIQNLHQNNLAIPYISIPMNQLILIQGQSGSGKSSFAIDTILREGRRRLLSALRLPSSDIPPVYADFPDPLPTTMGIEQDADMKLGSFETLGTFTEIHDQLAHLFVRHGITHCPMTNEPLTQTQPEQTIQILLTQYDQERICFLSPLQQCTKKNYKQTLLELQRAGFARIMIKNTIRNIEEAPPHPPKTWHLVIDRLKVQQKNKERMFHAVQQAYRSIYKRCGVFLYAQKKIVWFYQTPYSKELDSFLPAPNLALLRFRNSIGACRSCNGKGYTEGYVCSACKNTRLHEHAALIKWHTKTLPELLNYSIKELHTWLSAHDDPGAKEIRKKTQTLLDLRLHNLSLSRSFDRLSTGEKSRLRLFRLLILEIKQALFIIDEPSLGLSKEDLADIIPLLLTLKKQNTLMIVDHSPLFTKHADTIFYFGPKAGKNGGTILDAPPSFPPPASFKKKKFHKHISIPKYNASIPQGGLHVISGRSGSGKTTQLLQIHSHLKDHADYDTQLFTGTLKGSTRSCTATITGLWNHIRTLFASTKESRIQGYTHAQFSFNVAGGRCEACKGMGTTRIQIPPLPPQEELCSLCLGMRFNATTLQIEFKGYNVAQLLMLELQEALPIFRNHPKIYTLIHTLCTVGLGYLPLGQVSNTLSGGERRRLLMAKHLAKAQSNKLEMNRVVILLDEPSAALHAQDCTHILHLIEMLRNQHATIVCASNHPWLIERADTHTTLHLEEPIPTLD